MLNKIIYKAWNSPVITSWLKFISLSMRGGLVNPIVVTSLNPGQLTVYYLFNSILGYTPNLTNSVTGTYIRGFAYALSGAESFDLKTSKKSDQPNFSFFSQIYQTSNFVQILIGSFVVLCISTIGYFALRKPISQLEHTGIAWFAWGALVTSIVFKIWIERDGALIKGIGKIAVANRVDTLVSSTAAIILVIGLSFWNPFIALITSVYVALCMSTLFYINIIRNTDFYDHISRRVWPYHPESLNVIKKTSFKELILALVNLAVDRGGVILAAFALSGGSLAVYLNAVSILMICQGLSRAPFFAHTPKFARLRSEHETRKLAIFTGKSIRNSLLVFTALTTIFGFGMPVFYQIIGSNIAFMPPQHWFALTAVLFLARHDSMHQQIILSANKVPFFKQRIIIAFLKGLSMWVGAKYFGTLGFVLGLGLVNLLYMNWYAPKHSLKTLDNYAFCNLKQYVVYIPLCLILFIVFALYGSHLISHAQRLLDKLIAFL